MNTAVARSIERSREMHDRITIDEPVIVIDDEDDQDDVDILVWGAARFGAEYDHTFVWGQTYFREADTGVTTRAEEDAIGVQNNNEMVQNDDDEMVSSDDETDDEAGGRDVEMVDVAIGLEQRRVKRHLLKPRNKRVSVLKCHGKSYRVIKHGVVTKVKKLPTLKVKAYAVQKK